MAVLPDIDCYEFLSKYADFRVQNISKQDSRIIEAYTPAMLYNDLVKQIILTPFANVPMIFPEKAEKAEKEEVKEMPIIVKNVDRNGKDFIDLKSHIFLEKRQISVIGEIDDQMAMEVVFQLDYLDGVNKNDIHIYINSPGGSVSAGLSIIDAMRRCKSDVSTICTGITASMGAVIASCGTKGKRFITPNAEIMIHQPFGGAVGQASDVERAATHIAQIKRKLTEILVVNTGKSTDVITTDCDRDYYMSAAEAVEYGLADGILETNVW